MAPQELLKVQNQMTEHEKEEEMLVLFHFFEEKKKTRPFYK